MTRVMDERGRLFGRINVVDLLVVLAVVALAAFALTRLVGETSETRMTRVTYTIQEVKGPTVDQIKPGGAVRDDGGTSLGTIEKAVVRPSEVEVPAPNGDLVAQKSKILSDVDVFVLGEAEVSDTTVRIGSVPIRVGRKVTLIGAGFEVQTVITDWEVLK